MKHVGLCEEVAYFEIYFSYLKTSIIGFIAQLWIQDVFDIATRWFSLYLILYVSINSAISLFAFQCDCSGRSAKILILQAWKSIIPAHIPRQASLRKQLTFS